MPAFRTVYGVDFSGARLAGANTWVATLAARRGALALAALDRLSTLAGTADRDPALAHLTGLVAASRAALWGFDFPFGVPVELLPGRAGWPAHFASVADFGDEAYAWGLDCVRRTEELGLGKHARRASDTESRAPFDPYHYRIVYQTFHGTRSVLAPLRRDRATAVLPFHYGRLAAADRVVVEACPACLLKDLGLPHQNYKQPAGGPLTAKRRTTRRAIIDAVAARVTLPPALVRRMMRNPGADALDAVLAGYAAWRGVHAADHAAIARHPRYKREGRVYV